LTSVTFALGSMVIDTNGEISGGTIGTNAFAPSGLVTVYAYSNTIQAMVWTPITPTGPNATTSIGGKDVTVEYLNVHATTFSMSNTNLIAGQTSIVRLIFSEAVTGFSNDDITVQNGSLPSMTSSDNITWTGTFTPTENIEDATNVLTLSDDYTNNGIAGIGAESANYKIDTVLPIINAIETSAFSWGDVLNSVEDNANGTVTVTTRGVEDGQEVTVTLNGNTYKKSVSNNIAGLQDLTNDSSYTMTANVSDAAENAATQVTSSSFSVDTTLPTMTITSTTVTSGTTTNDLSIAITLTTETGTTFEQEDISVSNGTLSAFAGSGPYTATFTPTANTTGSISVAAGTFQDAYGNPNKASDIFTWTQDTIKPKMEITAKNSSNDVVSSESITNDATITLTFTSSEATNNFTVGNISFTNGLLSNFTGSGEDYTAIFTPSANGECTISVAAGTFQDAYGNDNTISNTFIWTQDTTLPTMTITSTSVADGATTTQALIALTFTSSEATTTFEQADITLVNGTLSAIAGSGKDYTATFTPTDDGVCTIDVAANKFNSNNKWNWRFYKRKLDWSCRT